MTPQMAKVLQHRAARAQQIPREQQHARGYWDGRKLELGITKEMSHADRVERISAARAHVVTHAPDRRQPYEQSVEVEVLEQRIRGLEQYVKALHAERTSEEALVRRGGQRPVASQARVERLLATGVEHGSGRDVQAEKAVAMHEALGRLRGLAQSLEVEETPQRGVRSRARILGREHDREQEHDCGYGMGW